MNLAIKNLSNIEYKNKELGSYNYFDRHSIYSNLKDALGHNPLLWLIPIGEGQSFENTYAGGYEFSVNPEKFREYNEYKSKNPNLL